jgi:hypothetical protein
LIPDLGRKKEITWVNKLFVKGNVPQFLHIPLPCTMARIVGNMWKKIEKARANPDLKDFIMLATESSSWKGEIYFNVLKEVPDDENVKLCGTYVTQVFDGPYNAVPKWIKEIDQYLSQMGKKAKKYYFYCTTCPKCARAYGS